MKTHAARGFISSQRFPVGFALGSVNVDVGDRTVVALVTKPSDTGMVSAGTLNAACTRSLVATNTARFRPREVNYAVTTRGVAGSVAFHAALLHFCDDHCIPSNANSSRAFCVAIEPTMSRLSSFPLHSRLSHAVCCALAAAALGGFAAPATAAGASDAAVASVAASSVTVQPGQSLNDVAIAVTQSHDRGVLARASRALFDANPQAFMKRDPSRLRLGATLTVPALDATGAVPAQEAAASGVAGVGASGGVAASGAASSATSGGAAPASATHVTPASSTAPAGASAATAAAAAPEPASTLPPVGASGLQTSGGAIQSASAASDATAPLASGAASQVAASGVQPANPVPTPAPASSAQIDWRVASAVGVAVAVLLVGFVTRIRRKAPQTEPDTGSTASGGERAKLRVVHDSAHDSPQDSPHDDAAGTMAGASSADGQTAPPGAAAAAARAIVASDRELASHAHEQPPAGAQPASPGADHHTAPGSVGASATPPEANSEHEFPADAVAAMGSVDMPLPPRVQSDPTAPAGAARDAGTHFTEGEKATNGQSTPRPPIEDEDPTPNIAEKQGNDAHTTAAARSAHWQRVQYDDDVDDDTDSPAPDSPLRSSTPLGGAPFAALKLDFDLDLPSSPSEVTAAFTPDELARIARNKLDLAAEYVELGDLSGARTLLQEVADANDAGTRDDARAMLAKLADRS
ncbi:FimV/HubP family polar landmark protein [Burkholderia guangdongensis]|uniref:FimV/HubP family polar landmark protein n=1 Tax=Burkholderia guangdongensis TaxID=1792500 RepID=UPI0031B56E6D